MSRTLLVDDKENWVTCPCTDCGAIERLGPRMGDGHVGLRFGDRERADWEITLNGVRVENDCIEAFAGENGWTLLYRNSPFACPCIDGVVKGGNHICTSLHLGAVEIKSTLRR